MAATQSKFVGTWSVWWIGGTQQNPASSAKHQMTITQDNNNALEGYINVENNANQTTYGQVVTLTDGTEYYSGTWVNSGDPQSQGPFALMLNDNSSGAFAGYFQNPPTGNAGSFPWVGVRNA